MEEVWGREQGFLSSLLLIDGDLSSIWRHIRFRVAGHPLKGAAVSLLLADICCMQARCARLRAEPVIRGEVSQETKKNTDAFFFLHII